MYSKYTVIKNRLNSGKIQSYSIALLIDGAKLKRDNFDVLPSKNICIEMMLEFMIEKKCSINARLEIVHACNRTQNTLIMR